MESVTFNAHRGDAILSKAIRVISRGIYNHISIEFRGMVYEAQIGKGVIKTLSTDWDSSTVHDRQVIGTTLGDELYDFLEAQVGKKYDYWGIFNFIFVITKQSEGKWFCSELAKVAFCKAVGFRNKGDYAQRESPSSFWVNLSLLAHGE